MKLRFGQRIYGGVTYSMSNMAPVDSILVMSQIKIGQINNISAMAILVS